MSYTRTRYRNVRRRGDVLYFKYKDEHGNWIEKRYGAGAPRDAKDAQEEAQSRADAIRAGIMDPRLEAMAEYAQRPIAVVIEEYVGVVRARRRTPKHVADLLANLTRWAAGTGVASLAEIDPVSTNRWLGEMDCCARTKNGYRTSVLALCRWVADYGKMPRNPLPSGIVTRFNEKADRRRQSRALNDEELDRMLAVAPPMRRVYYAVVLMMGLRWREAARLNWANVDFETQSLVMDPSQTKTGRGAELPIPDMVFDALLAIKPESFEPDDVIFTDGEPELRTWKRDLERAGVPWKDDRGRQADRKAARTTFNTRLRKAGVPAEVRQRLMRHSDINLTVGDDYSDMKLLDLRGAIETASPSFHQEPPDRNKQERTDTHSFKGTKTA